MITILAQANEAGITPGQLGGSVAAIAGGFLLNAWLKFLADRREREQAAREAAARERQENQSKIYQERLVGSNERMEKNIGALAQELAIQREVERVKHEENVRRFDTVCKAHCQNYKPVQ